MIPLPTYAKIKDRYCVGYFGDSEDVLTDLLKARPVVERELPGISLYICCADEKAHMFKDKVIPKSKLPEMIKEIAYFRELNGMSVAELLEESEIPFNLNYFSGRRA